MIKSSIDVIYDPVLQCERCMQKVSEEQRENRKGCTGKKPFKRPLIPGIYYSKCPGNFFNQAYAQLMDVHRLFRKGVLANTGGLLDQPAKYIDAMNFLEVLISEKEVEQLKTKSKKNGRK